MFFYIADTDENCVFVAVCVMNQRACECVSVRRHHAWLQMCLTCLCGGDERCVSLAVLPVDVQIRTLRQSYDDVHVTLITRDQQPYLERKATGTDELKHEGNGKRLRGELSKNVHGGEKQTSKDRSRTGRGEKKSADVVTGGRKVQSRQCQ